LLARLYAPTPAEMMSRPGFVDRSVSDFFGGGALRKTGRGSRSHVHLLISLSKNIALIALLMTLKKDSSKWIKTKGDVLRGFHWQDGYGAFSIGESQVRAVTEYIGGQEQRHETMTFEDELVGLADRCGAAFDPRHLWT